MNEEKYLKSKGKECPQCTSDDINTPVYPRIASATEVIIDRECFTCGCVWQDIYGLEGILLQED